MKKVLIISFYFPPRKSIGSIRMRGLAKYLPRFGWEPTILTARLPGIPDKKYNIAETPYPGDISEILKRNVTSNIVTKIKSIFSYPDEKRFWFKPAVNMGIKLLKKEKYDLLLSSSGPFTCHLIAKTLRDRFKIPWVADLRDLWTQNHDYRYGTIRKYFEKRLEIGSLHPADILVTVSLPFAHNLDILHPEKKIEVITNGFDSEEIFNEKLTKKFTITYTGKIYRNNQDPEIFFKSLKELIDKNKIDKNKLLVRFFGKKEYWIEEEIKKYQLEENIIQYGIIEREDALKKQSETQLLLLLNWNSEKEKGVIPGKIFEYLAANRPILAIGGAKDSVIVKLLNHTNAGNHASDRENIKKILINYYNGFLKNGRVQYRGEKSEINKFTHYKMAKKFTDIFNQLSR